MDGLIVNKNAREIERYVLKSKFKRMRKNGMTVYKRGRKSDKVVVFLSGGAVLKFTNYIQKLIDDLHIKNADILVFENNDAFNLTCIPKIADILQTMDYKDLTIVGCSMGGVIGSHLMSALNHLDIKKTLVCIDTPFHICSTIPQAFEQSFCVWRPDIYSLYKTTIEIVQEKYNYSDIFKITNLEQYKQYVFLHFGIDNYEFLSSMNPDIKKCAVISLYNELDPVVIRRFNIPTVDAYKRLLDSSSTFQEVCIKSDGPGHCTEWASEATASEANRSEFIRQLRKFI